MAASLPRRLRSVIFNAAIALLLLVMGVVGLPIALTRTGVMRYARLYFRSSIGLARIIGGVRLEIRGEIPRGDVLIASKHQSTLDVFAIYSNLPRGFFVMKRELTRLPVFGPYALRAGAVPVDRGGGREALKGMVADFAARRTEPCQVVIYPQGTRVAPGATAPYKIGVHALYEAFGTPVRIAVTNAGLFWEKSGILNPGVAVVEFLDLEIEPGLGRDDFMALIEREMEAGTTRLEAEALAARR